MTLISSIILDAYRESNMLPLSAVPNDAQNTEALRLYNALLGSLYGTDIGELLADWPLGDFGRDPTPGYQPIEGQRFVHHPPINSRFIAVNEHPISVDLTVRPQDGARYAIVDPFARLAAFPVTLNGNGRTIAGQPSLVLDTNGMMREWVYRADLGGWVQLTDVALTDDNPFPKEFDQMFSILLAYRLSPRYGRELSDLSTSILRTGRTMFIARYINSQPLKGNEEISWPYMSRQGYGQERSFTSNNGFNEGRPYG